MPREENGDKSERCPYGYGGCPAMGLLTGYAFKEYCDICAKKLEMESLRNPRFGPVGFS